MTMNAIDDADGLDPEIVAQLRELEPVRPGFLQRLVGMFEDNAARLLAEMETQVAQGDHESLRIAFHSLAGTSASLGARRLSALARIAERAASDGDGAALLALSPRLRSEFAAARQDLQVLLPAASP
jgi:HPt (histidine-containing phosphotransfer) domain-containing protein